MGSLGFNDYFAKTRLSPDVPLEQSRLSDILAFYDSSCVKRLFFAFDFDLRTSVPIHLQKRRNFEKSVRGCKSSVRISAVSSVPLVKNISRLKDLDKITLVSGTDRYLFISLTPSSDNDMIVSELHNIIYNCKFIPVITEIEKAALMIPEAAIASVYRIPRAIYQINFSNLSEKSVRSLAKNLIDSGKTVVFGSGDKFDICPYANPDYYLKLITRTVGQAVLGYFTLRHNRVFL